MSTPVTYVDSHETVYRRVLDEPDLYEIRDDKVFVTASAFRDRDKKPSVDRASMCSWSRTQHLPNNGVVRLDVAQVRQIGDVTKVTAKGSIEVVFAVDVVHRPNPTQEPENAAHAQVEANPSIPTDNVFRKLRSALAVLASDQWVMLPLSVRNLAKDPPAASRTAMAEQTDHGTEAGPGSPDSAVDVIPG